MSWNELMIEGRLKFEPRRTFHVSIPLTKDTRLLSTTGIESGIETLCNTPTVLRPLCSTQDALLQPENQPSARCKIYMRYLHWWLR